MPYAMSHPIETDVRTFWRIFFDEEYNRNLYEIELQFASVRVLESRTEHDGTFHRRVELVPNIAIPPAVARLVGDGSYHEVGRFDPQLGRYEARWIPRVGADKFSSRFELRAEPVSDRSCQRIMSFDNTVRIPLLGATIQRLTEQNHRTLLARVADFTNRWIRERGL